MYIEIIENINSLEDNVIWNIFVYNSSIDIRFSIIQWIVRSEPEPMIFGPIYCAYCGTASRSRNGKRSRHYSMCSRVYAFFSKLKCLCFKPIPFRYEYFTNRWQNSRTRIILLSFSLSLLSVPNVIKPKILCKYSLYLHFLFSITYGHFEWKKIVVAWPSTCWAIIIEKFHLIR